MVLFSKKIKCLNCGKNFKSKLERNKKRVYVCSNYDNYGKCKREIIHQDFILELLDKRFEKRLSNEEIKEVVKSIEVKNKNEFVIHLENEEPIIFSSNYIQY